MAYRIFDTDGTLVTESKGKAQWTHAVVADLVVETYERELADTTELMADYVSRGNWSQKEANRSIANARMNLEMAQRGGGHLWSTHRNIEQARKEIAKGLNSRMTNPRIVEVEQI